MKALPPIDPSTAAAAPTTISTLTATWFDRSPVEAGTTLLPPSQRFDPTRLSARRLLRRMPDTTCRAVHFDAGWDPIALELEEQLAERDPDFVITEAAARWAELRVVTSVDDDPAVRRLLAEAAGESITHCERCGQPGRPVRCMPRQRTLCPDHAAEHRFDEAIRITVEKLRRAEQELRSA